jgi:hypothetical protein
VETPTRDSAQAPGTPLAHDPYAYAAVGIAAAAVVLVLVGTRAGSLTGIDSAVYLAGARSLANGSGYLGIDLRPTTLFPAGFSTTLAGAQMLGVGAATAARWLNAIALGVLCLMTFGMARRHVRHRLTPVLAAAGIAVMPATFGVASAVWSEPIFCVIALGFVWVLEAVVDDHARRTRLLVIAGAIASISVIYRYAGLALVITGIAVVGVAALSDGRRALLRRVAIFAATGLVGPAVVVLLNLRHGTLFGPRTASAETLPSLAREIATTLRGWVVGTTHDQVILADLAAVAVVVAVMAGAAMRSRSHPQRSWTTDPIAAIAAFVVIYVVYVIASELTTTIDPVGDRLMSPIIAPCIILAAISLESFVDGPDRVPRAARIAALGIVVGAWLVASAGISVHRAAVTAPARNGYAVGWWTGSDLVAATRRLPAGATLFSNNSAGLYLATGLRPIESTPVSRIYRSSSTPPGLAAFRARVVAARQPAYLIWERLIGDTWDVTPQELSARGFHLTPLTQATFGTVYRIVP